jgi:ABC-type phosphate/phosphonate transport system substrate-binding protein
MAGEADAACFLESRYLAFVREGLLPPATSVLAYTAPYDHCNLTAGPAADRDRVQALHDLLLLLAMNYDDPEIKPLFDLEGLTAWRDARTTGYGLLEEAVDRLHLYEPGAL